MALQMFVSGNSHLLPLVNFSPKSGAHRLLSLQNSVKTSFHLQACLAAKTSQKIYNRPLSDFPPTVWNNLNIINSNSFSEPQQMQIEEFKENIKGMLMAPTNDQAQKLILINSLDRLGVSYHFETEIDDQLDHIFESQPNFLAENDYDFYSIAIMFRVFRQHGYRMSCDVFNKFKDSDGKFKEVLTSDAKGMLSLYEATHLRLHGEDILEEACAFTKAHLSSLAAKSSTHLAEQIMSALALPSHKGIPRLEARKYISFYEQDVESRNETLLKFAKLDFNRVQSLHQRELSYLKSWWKDLNLASKLPYARDRIVELYFVLSGIYFEPCYSRGRIMLCKQAMLYTVIDDTFDSYGTLEELQQFTEATRRWDASTLDELPDYLKLVYSSLLNLFDELNDEVSKEGRSYSVDYQKEAVHTTAKAYLQEVQWLHEGYVPPFEEYLSNAIVTAGVYSLTAASLVGMEEIADIEAFKWLQTKPKVSVASFLVSRLLNDIVPYYDKSAQQTSRQVTNGVECYMKQHGSSREETVKEFEKMFDNAWKDMNEECMKPTSVSIHLITRVVNFARCCEVIYQGNDAFTNPDNQFNSYVGLLYLDQIPI